jgi:predicted nucleic acid-binding protein
VAAADLMRFRRDLSRHAILALDSNVLIYHLEGLEPYRELTTALIAGLAAREWQAVISTITVAEILVGPHRSGTARKLTAAREFVEGLPNTLLADVTLDVADLGARLRARGARMPDALILATAALHEVGALVTNDASLRKLKGDIPPLLVLDDYIGGR